MVSITNANIKIGFIIGIVICIILRNAFAPSIAAASLTDSSIVVSPARKMTINQPMDRQMTSATMDHFINRGSSINGIFVPSTELITPVLVDNKILKIKAVATTDVICGKNRIPFTYRDKKTLPEFNATASRKDMTITGIMCTT